MKQILKRILHFEFIPPTCLFCEEKGYKNRNLCIECEKDLPWFKHHLNLPFQNNLCLFHYQFPIPFMITHLKFHEQLCYARLFADLLIDQIKIQYQTQPLPQLIIPVPLHPKRLKERGYNQALEIAKPIRRALHIPINTKDIIRKKHTQAQSDLPATKRALNIQDAFRLKNKLQADHIVLLDDVITTGATLKELARSIQKIQPITIDIWTITKTLHSTPQKKHLTLRHSREGGNPENNT